MIVSSHKTFSNNYVADNGLPECYDPCVVCSRPDISSSVAAYNLYRIMPVHELFPS